MKINTTRFGEIEIRENRIINFPDGLLGFGSARKFCLLEPSDDACFFWLQSLDDPSLAFVVTDPSLFVPDYEVPFDIMQMKSLHMSKLEDAQVFVIVNKINRTLTGNLMGPIVVETHLRLAKQVVLTDSRWTTRHPLVEVPT